MGNTIDQSVTTAPNSSIGVSRQKSEDTSSVHSEGSTRASPNGQNSENLDKTMQLAKTWVVGTTGIISTISGTLSFLFHNFLNKPTELIDQIATYASKASVFAIAIFGGITTGRKNNAFGTAAFTMDFLAPLIGTGEDLYQWKGWGSGTDHSIPILSEIKTNPKLKDQYEAAIITEGKVTKFKNYWVSAKLAVSSIGVIFGDIVNEFKKNGFIKGFMNCFIKANKNGNRTAEKNLLVSGLGILVGTFMGTILKFKLVGSTIRDVFGMYADFAYIDKGRSKVSGEGEDKNAKKDYLVGGILYTIGSVLDLIYRWTGLEGLNLFALGVDRLGHTSFVKGVAGDSETSQTNNGNHSNEPSPTLAGAAA